MAEVPQDTRKWLFGRGAKHHGRACTAGITLSLICLVIGIVCDVMDIELILETVNWLIIAAVFAVLSVAAWLTGYFAAKEGIK